MSRLFIAVLVIYSQYSTRAASSGAKLANLGGFGAGKFAHSNLQKSDCFESAVVALLTR